MAFQVGFHLSNEGPCWSAYGTVFFEFFSRFSLWIGSPRFVRRSSNHEPDRRCRLIRQAIPALEKGLSRRPGENGHPIDPATVGKRDASRSASGSALRPRPTPLCEKDGRRSERFLSLAVTGEFVCVLSVPGEKKRGPNPVSLEPRTNVNATLANRNAAVPHGQNALGPSLRSTSADLNLLRSRFATIGFDRFRPVFQHRSCCVRKVEGSGRGLEREATRAACLGLFGVVLLDTPNHHLIFAAVVGRFLLGGRMVFPVFSRKQVNN